jgi:hypothetical protein
VGTLANPELGEFLTRHYVSTYRKVGTFTVLKLGGRAVQKVGGNVAAYFCTPEGRVLHAIAGVVDAATFRREAEWARETYLKAVGRGDGDPELVASEIRAAHAERSANTAGSCFNLVRVQLNAISACNSVSDVNLAQVYSDSILEANGKAAAKVNKARLASPSCVYVATVNALKEADASPRVQAVTALGADVNSRVLVSTVVSGLILGQGAQVHSLLSKKGFDDIDGIYRTVFEQFLGEQISDEPVKEASLRANRTRNVRFLQATR